MIESDRGQARMKKVSELMRIAEQLGESLSKIAIAWCLVNENVSTIILGASKIEQLEENLKAPETLPLLTEEVQKRLGSI
jgi:aryl-alcohol dehydrogenase-like predicted oxidoreductase